MCGITGWVSYERDLTTQRPTVETMIATMACRGPDAAGSWLAPHAVLGHRRLAIIDRPGGTQPMTAETPTGTVAMTYSGEAYNYRELREQLRRLGHRFTTNSDTEVVLRGYLEWGTAVAETTQRHVRARDLGYPRERPGADQGPAGHQTPLLLSNARRVLFGSEPKAILANPLAERVIDTDGLRTLFVTIDAPDQAVWTGMRKVNPPPWYTLFAHDVAEHLSTQHQDIVLDSAALANLDTRTAVVRARDLPSGFGYSDVSLYLLFKAIREHSTVALSGESADEVFAGYRWFHDLNAVQADTFPWLAGAPGWIGQRTSLLAPPVIKALDVSHYIQDSYRSAVATVPRRDGKSDLDYRMRVTSHLHLTRMLGLLLDRKDRMSMAVGLEVRVPYCDHRLVEYLYNAPWSLKTFDGREKSLLRAAAADALPRSVVERVKSHYPQTHDPGYTRVIQRHARELLTDPAHPLFDLINRDTLTHGSTADPARLALSDRVDLEQAIDLAIWLELYQPAIRTR